MNEACNCIPTYIALPCVAFTVAMPLMAAFIFTMELGGHIPFLSDWLWTRGQKKRDAEEILRMRSLMKKSDDEARRFAEVGKVIYTECRFFSWGKYYPFLSDFLRDVDGIEDRINFPGVNKEKIKVIKRYVSFWLKYNKPILEWDCLNMRPLVSKWAEENDKLQ